MLRLLSLTILGLPGLVLAADTVCVGVPEASVSGVTPDNEHPSAVGTLSWRQCFAVTGRTADRTRVFVKANQGFVGDLELVDRDLAWVLVDDADLRLDPKEAPWGHVLSGALLTVEQRIGGGMALVRSLEGRIAVRFLVEETGIFPAAAWTEPDPKDHHRGEWPTATAAPPPLPAKVTATSVGGEVRAILGGPLLEITDLALDPGQGELRWEPVKKSAIDLLARLVQRNLWLEGFIQELDWRTDPPVDGWPAEAGVTKKPEPALPTRAIGETGAPISRAVKGAPFGQLQPGTRVELAEEDGSWVGVTARWYGGSVRGWGEKKRIVKEGKEAPVPGSAQRWAQVGLGDLSLEWAVPEGHPEPPELDTAVLRKTVLDAMPGLRRAFAAVLTRKPDSNGLLTARLVVDSAGVLTEVTVPVATMADEDFKTALIDVLRPVVLPKRKVVKKKGGPTDWNVVIWVPVTLSPR